MQAMMLAAGRGTRLGALGRSLPKALVPIAGKPLLAHQLEYLAVQGVERVVINAHHLAEQIVEFVRKNDQPLEVEVTVEPELLGTSGGVRAALHRFDLSTPIIVLYADTILAAPLRSVWDEHRRAGAHGTICATWLEDTKGKGVLECDADGTVLGFVEKPVDRRPGLTNAGLYVVDPALVALAPEGAFSDFGHDLFPQAMAAGLRLRAHRLYGDAAHDIGTPEALALAQRAA